MNTALVLSGLLLRIGVHGDPQSIREMGSFARWDSKALRPLIGGFYRPCEEAVLEQRVMSEPSEGRNPRTMQRMAERLVELKAVSISAERRLSLPLQPGKPARHDYEYRRMRSVTCSCSFSPGPVGGMCAAAAYAAMAIGPTAAAVAIKENTTVNSSFIFYTSTSIRL